MGVFLRLIEQGRITQNATRSCPAGNPGDDEAEVFHQLQQIVDERIELYRKEDRPLPPPTAGRDLANRLQDVL